MILKRFCPLISAFLIAACSPQTLVADAPLNCVAPAWRLAFVNGPNGEDLGGSRNDFFDAIRHGSPVRVGWGEADADGKWAVEEFSGTTFLNIMGDQDIVAQLEPALIQTNYTDATKAGLRDPLVDWHAVMSTDGRFEAITVSRASGEHLRTLVQRTTMHWYVFAPPPGCENDPAPELAPRGRLNEVVNDSREP